MKINFIRQISDDILRENHELRTNIILAKQQLQNFQDNMISFIRESQIQIPILTTPHQTLTLFMKTVNSRFADYQLQLKKQQVNTKVLNQLTKELQAKDQQVKRQRFSASERENKWKQEFDTIQKKYYQMQKKVSSFESVEYSLKQEIQSIRQKNIIERNIQEEGKKKQIEAVRLACHGQLLQFRDRVELQNVELEKKYKNQVGEKERRIKELEKLMEKLSANFKLDSSDTSMFATVMQAFQQSNKTRKIIEELKTQNAFTKKSLNELEKEKLELQSKLMQRNILLHNLQGQLERQKMDKIEFERNLRSKIKQYQKSEKDKQAMEQYYQKKWNRDFKKVKSQLQKAFLQKSQELETAYAGRMQQFQGKMVEWLQKINSFEFKNKELQKIHNLDRKQILKLRKEIQVLTQEVKELKLRLQETWRMSRQQIRSQKMAAQQKDEFLENEIIRLRNELERKQSNIQTQTEKIELTIKQLAQTHAVEMTKQLEQQKSIFQTQSQTLKVSYQQKISELNDCLHEYEAKLGKVKEQARTQLLKQVEVIRQTIERQNKQKDEELQRKLQKNAHKLRDLEMKLISSKKQSDQMLFTIQKERNALEKQAETLKLRIQSIEIELKSGLEDRKQMLELTKLLENKIETFKEMMAAKNKQLQQMHTRQRRAEFQVQQLQSKRNEWLSELKKVETDYKKEFAQLKNVFQKQLSMYKSKVWQLQGQYKKHYMSKKNYEKMMLLYSEKEELQNALEIKEAENIVLSQVKNFYQSQIEINEVKATISEHKAAKAYFTRKIEKHRKFTEKRQQKNETSNSDSKEVVQMKRYIKQSQKKQGYLSLAKSRYKEVVDFERVKTNPV